MDNGLGVGRQCGDGSNARIQERAESQDKLQTLIPPSLALVFQLHHENYQKLQNHSRKKSTQGDYYLEQLEVY